ncbi:hypothetical protein [Streptomyces sp. NPDC051310]|uniref:hypothetical protein n=1 Tax=Streptomyces sp. NPDC051310 TaxID=3365649 RepID=UPI0037A43686
MSDTVLDAPPGTTAGTGAAVEPPTETPLNFTGPRVEATLVRNARDHRIHGTAIVVNTGISAVPLAETPRTSIPALSSAILADTVIERADTLVLLRVHDDGGMAGITGEPGWALLGDLFGEDAAPGDGLPFPRETPLWKSPQDDAGTVTFDAAHLLKEIPEPAAPETFDIKVNLWYAPAGTDCFIHNQHDFIEVHTQVHGIGRMQKFREQDHRTLYQDVVMSPGYTTPDPFCSTGPDGTYVYPWHQYRADTDCVWLAVEYHRRTR